MGSIPGATVDARQKAEGGAVVNDDKEGKDRSTATVVFFLGGCTFTEIAALRWMSKQNKGRKFLIATTGIINGTSVGRLPLSCLKKIANDLASRKLGRSSFCKARSDKMNLLSRLTLSPATCTV